MFFLPQIYIYLQTIGIHIPCEQQLLIELAINSGDFW
jgi:hypothetical protein